MLRYLRENTGNWIIKFFLGIIVIVFVFLGVGSMNASKRNEVAVVNDQVITFNEFQDAYRNMIEQMRQQFGNAMNDDLLKALNVKQRAVNSLVDQKILDIEADKLKIMVTDQELQDTLRGIKAFQKNGAFDMALYKLVLSKNRLTPETFEALQRRTIKNRKLQEMVLAGITISDAEADTWYRYKNTQMAIDYIKVDPSTFTDISPTPEQIKKQFADHPDLYQSQPKLKAKYLVFSPEDYKGAAGISDDQAREFFEQNLARFTTPEQVEASHILIRLAEDADDAAVAKARKLAEEVYEKAVKGEDFAQLAKAFSQGPTAPQGGYLGKFDRRSMVEPFGEAAFALKAGEISKPVRTQFGFHVIKAMGKTPEATQSFETVKADIIKEIEGQELQNLAYYKAGEAFDSVVDGDDFEQVALIAKKKILNTEAFDADGKGLLVENAGEFARTAFTLVKDEISEVKQLGDKYYLIKVVEKIEPEPLPLEEVEAGIRESLTTSLQKEAAQKTAASLLKKIESKVSMADAAKESHLVLASSPLFKRDQAIKDIAESNPLVLAAFTLDKENPVYNKVVEAGQNFYVIGFKEKQEPDAAGTPESLSKVKQELVYMKQQQDYSAWINSLKVKADIKINQEIIN